MQLLIHVGIKVKSMLVQGAPGICIVVICKVIIWQFFMVLENMVNTDTGNGLVPVQYQAIT